MIDNKWVEYVFSLLKKPYFYRHSPTDILEWTDGEYDLFKKAKKLPNFPEQYLDYKKNPIYYKYNEMGYRSNNFIPPTDKEYIMVFGCSHSWGSSLPQEKRYSDILENITNMQVINAAIPGGSANFILEHVLLLLLNVKHLPKYVVFQWPNWNRYILIGANEEYIINTHAKGIENNIYNIFMKLDENIFLYKFIQSYLIVNKFLEEKNVKCINFAFADDTNNILSCKYISFLDIARDGQHPGEKTHQFVADYILQELGFKSGN